MTTATVKLLLFICLFFITGALVAERKDYTREEYAFMSRSVHEIVDVFEKEMKEKFGLVCIGQGGSMPYDIQSIGVDFVVHRQMTIEEARELEIRSTERFIEIINSHEAIRPYLRDYPWDHNRAEVMISFNQENGDDYSQGIRLIFIAKEKVLYYGPKKSSDEVGITIKREPYLEAKNIVYSTPSCLKPVQKKKKWFGWL
ncbi:MAG: hypothetical protein JSS09_08245 [Verrucomicrobia bacterium]|nr:hypothetical protein [Verrucomicrobiota bacterium]